MKWMKSTVAAALLLSMLLSLPGGGFARAAGTRSVPVGQEPVFEPLAETTDIVFERHAEGYGVALDRRADCVAVTVTAPAAEGNRAADKARLYVNSGVALKAGTTYRVSFALSAERAQPSYAVCFDDGAAESAYGELTGRSIAAGGTDRVRYLITPESDSGALTLRLLLGDTAGNTLRFSDFAVEQADAGKEPVVLADRLDYNAPGSVRLWTDADSKATVTADGGSATLTVDKIPARGAEVWKIKLLIATGLRPEAGKSYRVRAEVQSTAAATYEVCWNAGDTEKGYDVLYDQKLTGQPQVLDRTLYVSRDKTNPGEIVLQLSLGKVPEGQSVTVKNVTVEEASQRFSNALPKNFSLDAEYLAERYNSEQLPTRVQNADALTIDWNGPVVSKFDWMAGDLSVKRDAATLAINPGNDGTGVWNAKLIVNTRKTVEAGKTYRVSFTVNSSAERGADAPIEVLCGTDYLDNAEKHGSLKGITLQKDVDTPISLSFMAQTNEALFVTFQLGRQFGARHTVTVSGFKVEQVELGAFEGDELASVTYPVANYYLDTPDNCNKAVTSASGNEVKLQVTEIVSDAEATWRTKLVFRTGVEMTAGSSYNVSYKIRRENGDNTDKNWEFGFGRTTEYDEGKYGNWFKPFEMTTSDTPVNETITLPADSPDGGHELCIFFKLGGYTDTYHISDVTVTKTAGTPEETKTQPKYGSFSLGINDSDPYFGGCLTGDGSSATLVCSSTRDDQWGDGDNKWKRKLYADNICMLDDGSDYEVSFDISTTIGINFNTSYNMGDNGPGEDKYGNSGNVWVGDNETKTVTQQITGQGAALNLQLNLGDGQRNANIRVSNISVKKRALLLTTVAEGFCTVWGEAPVAEYQMDPITVSKSATVLNVTQAPSRSHENWKDWNTKLFIRPLAAPVPGQDYRVSFTIKAASGQQAFHVLYGDGSDATAYGGEYEIPLEPNVPKTIAHNIPNCKGDVILQINLGLIDHPTGNIFTVTDVKLEAVELNWVDTSIFGMKQTGTVYSDSQSGYSSEITRTKDSATMRILSAPEPAEREGWKSKLFIDTGVLPKKGETYRVCVDVLAQQDMTFDVCYNRVTLEKGFDGVFALKAAAGKVMTVEKVFTAPDALEGLLFIQLTLGMASAPNAVTVSNVRVEKVTYSYAGSGVAPIALNYREGSAVSFWAHEDYAVDLSGSDGGSVLNITRAPARNAEGWKVKLFVETGVRPEPGKYYRVTADLSADKAQTFAFLCNNGAGEGGYNELWNLNLTPGETTAVESVFSVPEGTAKTDNLVLQLNMGQTSAPNRVTLRGIRVEEVQITYVDAMPAGYSYAAQDSVSFWTDTGCAAALDRSASAATLRVTEVPDGGAAVWQAQLRVNTGVVPEAGKTYLVRANLNAAKAQGFEVNFNNEEVEKDYGALYGQSLKAGDNALEYALNIPAGKTDAGKLILGLLVGGPAANDITVSGLSVREMDYGVGGTAQGGHSAVVSCASGTLDVSREALRCRPGEGEGVTVAGADLRAGERYTVAFTGRADKALSGTFRLTGADGAAALSKPFDLSETAREFSFTTDGRLPASGLYDLVWEFDGAAELSAIRVSAAAETLEITHDAQKVTFNGKTVTPDAYNINGSNYFRLRDLAAMFNDTCAGFVVRYNAASNAVSVTTEREYTPVGNELKVASDQSATCVRSPQTVLVNGRSVNLKAYNIGGNNYFRLRDLDDVLNFAVDYDEASNTAVLSSPLSPKAQEAAHSYDAFFLPEIDGESQGYVGDTMPFYDNGTYYIYYLKEGGDAYNHSVYLTTTTDFASYTEVDAPVLSASRENAQDLWIGTGSVCKAEGTYYFFYTGFNPSEGAAYREKIMVAKGSSPTSFEKVKGWEITPPDDLGQKTDFRDPQAYYDPESGSFSLTVTASQNGRARILRYTLDKNLENPVYNGVIFTDPTGEFYNLECSDTFKMGDKWYLTYSGQEDTLWYAAADSRFGPYGEPTRLDGRLFYAAKHVENNGEVYMVGWARRSDSPTDTGAVSGWGGNVAVQKLRQNADGSLALVPVDAVVSSFAKESAVADVSLSAGAERRYQEAFPCGESFVLRGEFTATGSGRFGLAFDYNGSEQAYKLIALDPAAGKLSLSFMNGDRPITETKAAIASGEKHSFTYIQDGSVGIFYLDGQASLTVRLYGVADRPIRLFAENASVTFTSLRQYTK